MRKGFVATLLFVLVIVNASIAAAAPFAFKATINTAPLIGSPLGPFWLDFQLNGLGPAINQVTITNFQFFGGGPLADPPVLIGNVSGSLTTSVTLSSSGFFNEFFQAFTPGTILRFDVMFAALNVNSPTPDAFAVSILDGNLLNLPTTGFANTLLYFDINSQTLQPGSVQTAVTTAPSGVSAAVSAIPEPTSLLLLATGCAILLRRARPRRQARSATASARARGWGPAP